MPSFNKAIIMGHLTRDPEVRYTPKGTAVCDITLGVNRTWNGEDGTKHEEVSFIDVVLFSGRAETLSKYLKKGDPLLVEGYLKQETWDDKQSGQKRSRIKIICESFSFVGGREGAATAPAARPARHAPARAAAGKPAASARDQVRSAVPAAPNDDLPRDDDDVPF